MSDSQDILIGAVSGGMNGAVDPAFLPVGQYARGVNVQLKKQRVATRPGSQAIPMVFATEEAEEFRTLNIQGARHYNPAKGQGLLQTSVNDSAYIVVSAGGKRFSLLYREDNGQRRVVVEKIPGPDSRADLQLAWIEQAENYAIATDGVGDAWIWDGQMDARSSIGFNPSDGEPSEIPSGSSAVLYSNGRLWAVVNARQIVAGDIVHASNQTTAENLLSFTEQGYWAEGQYFLPPNAMGDVIAAAILPIRDTAQGQGEAIFHTVDGGIFSIQTNVFPRSTWSETPMVKYLLLDTSATGPYAIDMLDGDQFFRSRYGIQTLRSARAESSALGRPHQPISSEVNVWLDRDYRPSLRFASLNLWTATERLLCTTQPEDELGHRYHRGIVSLNLDPVDSGQPLRSWEGLWTFPAESKNVIQMINGLFMSDEKQFILTRGDDGENRLLLLDPSLKHDILEDGSVSPIISSVVTREGIGGNSVEEKEWTGGRAYMRNVCGSVDISFKSRTDKERCWTDWHEQTLGCDKANPDPCDIRAQAPYNFDVNLGKPDDASKNGRRLQVLARWKGYAELEAVKAGYSRKPDATYDVNTPACDPSPACCDSIDFEYSNSEVV